MAVGPHQDQAPLVERGDRRVRDRQDGERHLPGREGAFDRIRLGVTEAQKRKAGPESIEDRAPLAEPGMRRAAARIGGRDDIR